MDILQHDESELWQQYLTKPTAEYRDILINKYSGYANILAAKLFASRQVLEIEFDEFKQFSMVGLIESIDRYNPSLGATFKTYASHRIKGAVLDGIEKYCEKQQQISEYIDKEIKITKSAIILSNNIGILFDVYKSPKSISEYCRRVHGIFISRIIADISIGYISAFEIFINSLIYHNKLLIIL